MKRRKQPQEAQSGRWTVHVVGAEKLYRNYSDFDYDAKAINGTVAVRLAFSREWRMTFGTIKITDPDFEDKITTMKAEALERAAALQAVEAR